MKNPHDVIIEPVVSEKSYALLDDSRYTFVVHTSANKTEIRQAVEAIWGVRVRKVNTLNRPGKKVRFGLMQGQRKRTKRAIVTLAEGDEIDIFA